jgi:hypothetical protein
MRHSGLAVFGRLRLKCDGTRAETRFRLSAKWTSLFNRRGRQFSRLLAGELCTSACRVCTARANPCSAVMLCLLITHAILLFPLHFSHASPRAITFQLDSNCVSGHWVARVKAPHFVVWSGKNLPILRNLKTRNVSAYKTAWGRALPWEASSSSTSQQFRSILWNPTVFYRVNKSLALLPMLSQINPVHIHFYLRRLIFVLSSYLPLGLPMDMYEG